MGIVNKLFVRVCCGFTRNNNYPVVSKRVFSKMSDLDVPEVVDLGGMRKPYKTSTEAFTENHVPGDPLELFKQWFDIACRTDGIHEVNAMVLATADKSGMPSARYLLLKKYSKNGFYFYTNFESRKGKELAENPQASLLFYWDILNRQVRIEGTVEKVSEAEADEYFHSRPRSSQISAIVSNQSSVVESRNALLEKQSELEKLYEDPLKKIPKPNYWGGYRVIPKVIEFWQGQTDRLHDRIRFRLKNPNEIVDENFTHIGEDGWVYERLSP